MPSERSGSPRVRRSDADAFGLSDFRTLGRQRRTRTVCIALVALLTAPACAPPAPVAIDTKSDACARCRMSIDTLAHAAEIVTSDGDIRKYDSLGCLLGDYREQTRGGRRVAGAWVVDYDTKAWLKAEEARYALVNLPTDHMGFGAVAASSQAAALKLAGGDASKVVDWQTLIANR